MTTLDKDAVQKYLEKRWLDTGMNHDKPSMLFYPQRLAWATGLSLHQVKQQLRHLRTLGIVGYCWFEDNMNYCNCINESNNHCECEYVPFGNGYWAWYFNNWHKNKKYKP